MKESILPCTSGLLASAANPSLRPLIFSKDDIGDVGDCSGELSGDEDGDSEVLILVVRVRKMGILAVGSGNIAAWYVSEIGVQVVGRS
jgi:hypothetical protein